MIEFMDKYSNKIVNNNKLHYSLFVIILLVLTAYSEYVNTPLMTGHDTRVHYLRIHSLIEAMTNGQFPWYIDYNHINSYGYFMKAFYSDILLLPFAFIGSFTNTLFAYHLILITTTIATGVSIFWAIRRMFGNYKMACIAGILYTFCNYRLLDCYIRGALGEMLTFIILPIIIVGAYEIIKGDYKKWYILAIGFTLLIYSHLLSTILISVILGFVLILFFKRFIKEPIRIKYLIVAVLSVIALTAYYVAPMVEQMQSNKFVFSLGLTYPISLKDTGLSTIDVIRGMFDASIYKSYSFIPRMGFFVVWCLIARVFVTDRSKTTKYIDLLVLCGFIFVLASRYAFPWNIFPLSLFNFIQFPWRLFIFASLIFSIAGAYYTSKVLKNNTVYLGFIIFISILAYIPIHSESYTVILSNRNMDGIGSNFSDLPETKRYDYGQAEYAPLKLFKYIDTLDESERKSTSQDSTTLITNYKLEKGIISFDINQPDKIEIPQTYYLGYAAYVNDKPVELSQSDKGLISLDIKESGRAEVYYKATTIQIISTTITCITMLLFVLYIFYFAGRNKKQRLKNIS